MCKLIFVFNIALKRSWFIIQSEIVEQEECGAKI